MCRIGAARSSGRWGPLIGMTGRSQPRHVLIGQFCADLRATPVTRDVSPMPAAGRSGWPSSLSVGSRAAIKRTRVRTSHFQVISHRVMERWESARLDR
jgi:hypothetical protein